MILVTHLERQQQRAEVIKVASIKSSSSIPDNYKLCVCIQMKYQPGVEIIISLKGSSEDVINHVMFSESNVLALAGEDGCALQIALSSLACRSHPNVQTCEFQLWWRHQDAQGR